jgi:hypothetical protein
MGEDPMGETWQSGQPTKTTNDGITQAGVTTKVDVDSLESVVPWLQGLRDYIQDRLIPDSAKMALTDDLSKLYFGDVGSTGSVAATHGRYLQGVVDGYRAVAQSLDAAVTATQDIVKNYRDAEHNNQLTAAAVDKSFASGSPSGSATGGSSTAGSTTTPTSSTQPGSTTGSTQGGYA